jgi:hypothetical protein
MLAMWCCTRHSKRTWFPASGATVLNISLPAQNSFQPGLRRMDSPDPIVRMSEVGKNEAEAAALLLWLTERYKNRNVAMGRTI